METKNDNNALVLSELDASVVAMQDKFALACQTAASMELQDNATAAFKAVCVVKMLRDALTDPVVTQVFMPLMNTKIGFRTDRDPSKPQKQKDGSYKNPVPYSKEVVRDCLIDAIINNLMPTGNQFNIISGNMYPTKEGYTALLKKIGCKYVISYSQDMTPQSQASAEIRCNIAYEWNGEKNGFTMVANVAKTGNSTYDFIKGKAERRAKKALYEYLTGCDLGEADEDSSIPAAELTPNGGEGNKPISMPQSQAEQAPVQPAQVPTQRSAMDTAGAQAAGSWRQKMQQNANNQGGGPAF